MTIKRISALTLIIWQPALRIWLGCVMAYNGRFIFTYGQDEFWHHFFRTTLHFPFPDTMFYLSKGAEFFGGLLLAVGFLTQISSALIAFTMLIATITANLNNIYGGYGSITFSYFLFALLLFLAKPDILSLDHWIFGKRKWVYKSKKNQISVLLVFIRIWFGTLLLVNSIQVVISGKPDLFFLWSNRLNSVWANRIFWAGAIVQTICGLFLLTGLFRKISSVVVVLSLGLSIAHSYSQEIGTGGYSSSMMVVLFWLACISFFPAPSHRSQDRDVGSPGTELEFAL